MIKELTSNITITTLKKYQEYDELTKALTQYPLKGYSEGLPGSKSGPLFMPTAQLTRNRGDNCDIKEITETTQKIDGSCYDTDERLGGLGYHSRILNLDVLTAQYVIHCLQYQRFDVQNIHASSQAGVLAFYDLQPHS